MNYTIFDIDSSVKEICENNDYHENLQEILESYNCDLNTTHKSLIYCTVKHYLLKNKAQQYREWKDWFEGWDF